ncbi:MAG: DUF5652 family protein [Patescibacteria group bacterium]
MQDLNSFIIDFVWVFVLLMIWQLVWKGLALWKAGKRQDKVWFVILFLLNTLGILDIIYLFAVKTKQTPTNNNN